MNGEWLQIIDEEGYRPGAKPFYTFNFIGTTNYDWSIKVLESPLVYKITNKLLAFCPLFIQISWMGKTRLYGLALNLTVLKICSTLKFIFPDLE